MKTIHKFTLQQHGPAVVPMPRGAKILHVGNQCGAIQLWTEVDPTQPLESRHIFVAFTGETLDDEAREYLGTWISSGGSTVAHVFEDLGMTQPQSQQLAEAPEPFHPDASHIPPDYRDGWNAALAAVKVYSSQQPPASDASRDGPVLDDPDVRTLRKWLNEEPNRPVDRQALARVLAAFAGSVELPEAAYIGGEVCGVAVEPSYTADQLQAYGASREEAGRLKGVDQGQALALLAADGQEIEASGWQPIETAPRGSGEDGPGNTTHPDYVEPPRLLLNTAEGVIVGYYDWYYHSGYGRGAEPGVSAWRDTSGGQAYEPTHWMPLPQPPATS